MPPLTAPVGALRREIVPSPQPAVARAGDQVGDARRLQDLAGGPAPDRLLRPASAEPVANAILAAERLRLQLQDDGGAPAGCDVLHPQPAGVAFGTGYAAAGEARSGTPASEDDMVSTHWYRRPATQHAAPALPSRVRSPLA
jgi:hypothetical protein